MVAVISKKKETNLPTCWQPFAIKTGKFKTFGSGNNVKSTTGHVWPGMSLPGLP